MIRASIGNILCFRLVIVLLGTTAIVAADVSPSWTLTESLAAPEANQAAVADEHWVFAITNAQVAKYDRLTGKRMAVSTGEAKHLNSGFLGEGRLYRAHSNYPQTPERSEIKVLDLQSMQLSTFKNFGNFGGSLTWVVQQDGVWWCNFARYGLDNAQTFLVKFDTRWNELGRWTYPRDVIGELGRYSISGGIWRNGHWLVTGHDDPVLFRLRLPSQGTVLELVDKQQIPFTGQGIANDPKTGGLVGINRAERQVVFASQQTTKAIRLRVLSYNIHHGEGVDGKLDLKRIARVIQTVEPDLVALQEVDRNVTRTQSIDQLAELARLTQMQGVFGGNIALQGGEYGNAVLSRFSVRRHENHKLPCLDQGEQRGVLELEVDLPGQVQPLLFFATHLDHRPKGDERVASAKAINSLVNRDANRPAVLAGDLNDVVESAALNEFFKEWSRTNEQSLPTIPVGTPQRQIDFILFRPRTRWRVIDCRVLDEALASDHRPILAVLEFSP